METLKELKREVLDILKNTELEKEQTEEEIDEMINIREIDHYHTKLAYNEDTKEYKIYGTSLIKTAYHLINGSEKTIKDRKELYASIIDKIYTTKDKDEIIVFLLQTVITNDCYRVLQKECKTKQVEEYLPEIADKFDKLELNIVNKLTNKYKEIYTKERIVDKLVKIISTVDYEMKLTDLDR